MWYIIFLQTRHPDNCYSPSVTAPRPPPATHKLSRRVFAQFIGFCCCCCFGRLPVPKGAPCPIAASVPSLVPISTPTAKDGGEEPPSERLESGRLAAIPRLAGVAAFVRKLPLVVHASYNLPSQTRQHLLQSQYYITTIGLHRAR